MVDHVVDNDAEVMHAIDKEELCLLFAMVYWNVGREHLEEAPLFGIDVLQCTDVSDHYCN